MAIVTLGPYQGYGVNTDTLSLMILTQTKPFETAPDHASYRFGAEISTYFGAFTYVDGLPAGGPFTGFREVVDGVVVADITGISLTFEDVTGLALSQSNSVAMMYVLSGDDRVTGSPLDDIINTMAGADTVFAGDGNDTIRGLDGADYLRGEGGNDLLVGGNDFDDINGNTGNDSAYGNNGDDWVVGGKDQDFLSGGNGFDIVYGNMGDDTVSGDAGNDWVRGGQGNDSVSGGAGDDWLWGDRGDDTISGGSGADIFHSFAGAGLDRVIDFSLAEGDRVQLDPGTTYTIKQVGADTVIDLGGGDQVVLVGVQASTLAAASVFVG